MAAPKHARIGRRQLSRFEGDLVYWRPCCGVPHRARLDLRLWVGEGVVH